LGFYGVLWLVLVGMRAPPPGVGLESQTNVGSAWLGPSLWRLSLLYAPVAAIAARLVPTCGAPPAAAVSA